MTIHGSAEFSPCGKHRLILSRWHSDGPRALVCMANPSDAGAERNDPTIRRLNALLLHRYAGYDVVNWETYIATDPGDLHRWRCDAWQIDPDYDGRRRANLARVRDLSERAAIRTIAWGNLVPQVPQTTWILRAMSLDFASDLYAFGTTLSGAPKHPMARGKHRIADDAELIVWRRARELVG